MATKFPKTQAVDTMFPNGLVSTLYPMNEESIQAGQPSRRSTTIIHPVVVSQREPLSETSPRKEKRKPKKSAKSDRSRSKEARLERGLRG